MRGVQLLRSERRGGPWGRGVGISTSCLAVHSGLLSLWGWVSWCPTPPLHPSHPGISGKGPGATASEGPGGAFARISDSIPPLPRPQQPPGEGDEDDWEA